MYFYLLVLSQVNDSVLRQTKKVKNSKGISGSGICEWGGTLADVETAYYYQIAFDRHFSGLSDTILASYVHGTDAAIAVYDDLVGAHSADDIIQRGATGYMPATPADIKKWWTMQTGDWISGTWIPYGHQVCENADGDGLTEVCARQMAYTKPKSQEHAINVDNMSWCLTFTEDYKVTKFLEIGPNVSWKTDIHALTYHYCAEGACDGQGEGETVIWEFDNGCFMFGGC